VSKIFEALEHARQKLRRTPATASPPDIGRAPTISSSLDTDGLNMEYEMIELYQTIKSLLSEDKRRIIQFMGSLAREGTSSIARAFARALALRVGKKVFLLLGQSTIGGNTIFNIKIDNFIEDVIKGNNPIDEALYEVGDTNLFVGMISGGTKLSPDLFDSPKIDKLWDQLRERFDIVVIDSPPANISSVGFAICRTVDGVILVVEAEKTRWPVTLSVKERIEHQGGKEKLLGVVFNKRRFYIPAWIYKRL